MRILLKSIFVMSVVMALTFEVSALPQDGITEHTIDNFKESPAGRTPKGWRSWPFEGGKVEKVYKIVKESDTVFLTARDDKDLSAQIMRYFHWPIDRYPYLSWSWRAQELPKGARENDDSKNDSACGIYVIFGRTSGHAIKYVWSTDLPIETTITRRDGKLKIKVLESGAKSLGSWKRNIVKIPDDYMALFEKALAKNPSGIGILTDGNATHSSSWCDYKDFMISKEPPK